jgi:ribosomal-protein-alanine N-acetyltransferase
MKPIDSRLEPMPTSASRLVVVCASQGDLPHLLRLERLGMTHPWTEPGLLEELRHPDSLMLIATLGATAGAIAFLAARRCSNEAEILRVVVDPSHRGRGIASRLLSAALEQLAHEGIQDFYLEVREDNAAALSLYEKFSFRVLARRSRYYPDGCAALVMKAGPGSLAE